MSTPHIESQHTPGDWRMAIKPEHPFDGFPYIEIKAGCGYATKQQKGFQFTSFMNEADARLIIAAPKLLQCLIHLVDRDWFKDGESGQVVCCLDADLVRTALTAALSLPAPEVTTPVKTQSELMTVKNETRVGFLPFYHAGETIGKGYGFRTPTGMVDGFQTLAVAQRIATRQEEQDRAEAETGTGPIAAVLRKHFAAEAGKEVA